MVHPASRPGLKDEVKLPALTTNQAHQDTANDEPEPNMALFSTTPQKLEVDGQMLPIASMLRRCTAIAVDLCLAVGVGSVAFYLISLVVPLDSSSAKFPISAVMLLVIAYVGIGRNRFVSPGRHLFRLRLARLPGPVPGLYGKSITVHLDPEPKEDASQTTRACVAVGLSTVLAILSLSAALQTTTVYKAVVRHTEEVKPLGAERGVNPELSSVPRALLIGQTRAYAQFTAYWGQRQGVLEYFLSRARGGRWEIEVVRETEPHSFGNYSLGISEKEIPRP